MKLVSSNENKLKEFKRLGLLDLEISRGVDLKEVDSDKYTVCKYKALNNGPNTISEDTSLEVDGAEIGVNVKWLQEELPKHAGKQATWCVVLGVNLGDEIKIYEGRITGVLTADVKVQGFGFDSFLIPEGSTRTLSELSLEGKKDEFSARKNAVLAYLEDDYTQIHKVSKIEDWTGSYQ